MSYNINHWTTKELRGLRIPLKRLEDVDYLEGPELDTKTGTLTYDRLSEGFELRGKQDGNVLVVEYITSYGEGSGHTFDDLEEILSESTGYLRAVLVWEGGDSITRLVVDNGKVTNEDIELE